MSTRPGSTFDAMALTSLGPEEFDDPEPEFPELSELPELLELPELPEKPRPPNGKPPEPLPDAPDPERGASCPLPATFEADRLEVPLFHAPWPMPIPAANTASAAPPTNNPLRTLWVPLAVVGGAGGAGQPPVSPGEAGKPAAAPQRGGAPAG